MVQLPILPVVDEARAANRALRVEYVAARAVINNDGRSEVAVEDGQVLDVVSAVLDTGVAEKTVGNGPVRVKKVKEGVGILVQAGG